MVMVRQRQPAVQTFQAKLEQVFIIRQAGRSLESRQVELVKIKLDLAAVGDIGIVLAIASAAAG
jgi:hypothetical protein